MNLLYVLLVANLVPVIGSVITGYEVHEVTAFLALNFAVFGTGLAMLSLNGLKNLYDMITGVSSTKRGEVDVRKVE